MSKYRNFHENLTLISFFIEFEKEKNCTRYDFVATLNFNCFNGAKEVNTVYVFNFHRFCKQNFFSIVKKFLMFLLNGPKALMIILSFIQVSLC